MLKYKRQSNGAQLYAVVTLSSKYTMDIDQAGGGLQPVATTPSSGNLSPPVGGKIDNSSTKLAFLTILKNVKSNLEVTFYIFFNC